MTKKNLKSEETRRTRATVANSAFVLALPLAADVPDHRVAGEEGVCLSVEHGEEARVGLTAASVLCSDQLFPVLGMEEEVYPVHQSLWRERRQLTAQTWETGLSV